MAPLVTLLCFIFVAYLAPVLISHALMHARREKVGGGGATTTGKSDLMSASLEPVTILMVNQSAVGQDQVGTARRIPWRVVRTAYEREDGYVCHVVLYRLLAGYHACVPVPHMTLEMARSLTPTWDPLEGWHLEYPRGISKRLSDVRLMSVFDSVVVKKNADHHDIAIAAEFEGSTLRTMAVPIGSSSSAEPWSSSGNRQQQQQQVVAQQMMVTQTGTPVAGTGIYGGLAQASSSLVELKAGLAMIPLDAFETNLKQLQGFVAGVTGTLETIPGGAALVPIIGGIGQIKGGILGAVLGAVRGPMSILSTVLQSKVRIVADIEQRLGQFTPGAFFPLPTGSGGGPGGSGSASASASSFSSPFFNNAIFATPRIMG